MGIHGEKRVNFFNSMTLNHIFDTCFTFLACVCVWWQNLVTNFNHLLEFKYIYCITICDVFIIFIWKSILSKPLNIIIRRFLTLWFFKAITYQCIEKNAKTRIRFSICSRCLFHLTLFLQLSDSIQVRKWRFVGKSDSKQWRSGFVVKSGSNRRRWRKAKKNCFSLRLNKRLSFFT